MDWKEINRIARERDIFIYGRSEDWVHKAIAKLEKNPVAIIDREPSYHDTEYLGLRIMPIEMVEFKQKPFFIVTAADYGGIVEGLEQSGCKHGQDYALSPDFASYEVLSKIREHSVRLLIACSDYNDQTRARSSKRGGGLYVLDSETHTLDLVAVGSFRQVVELDSGFVAVDYVDKQLIFFNKEFSVTQHANLPYPNSCGVAIDLERKLLYIANAGIDLIEVFDLETVTKKNEVKLDAPQILPGGSHHLNDLYIYQGTLYFTYFSRSGQWKKGIFDGGLSALPCSLLEKANSVTIPEPLINNLWKPHTPYVLKDEVFVLDSMRGRLLKGSNQLLARFPGFIRGLTHCSKYLYIGMSEDMYVVDRSDSSGCMLNSGVFILDSLNQAYRFIPTYGIMNIHSIMVLQK